MTWGPQFTQVIDVENYANISGCHYIWVFKHIHKIWVEALYLEYDNEKPFSFCSISAKKYQKIFLEFIALNRTQPSSPIRKHMLFCCQSKVFEFSWVMKWIHFKESTAVKFKNPKSLTFLEGFPPFNTCIKYQSNQTYWHNLYFPVSSLSLSHIAPIFAVLHFRCVSKVLYFRIVYGVFKILLSRKTENRSLH